MSSNHLTLYLNNVFDLAKTLVIKSEYSASSLNTKLVQKFGIESVDPSRPNTWKYYLNICGEYHPTDAHMQVISLDTLQTITFSKESLTLHPATQAGYQYNSRFYKELVAKYPEQEKLILGILYPATMEQALEAPDYSVLSFNPALVEENEEHLIEGIDTFCRNAAFRWRNGAFNVTHNLYDVSFNNVLYQYLVPVILKLRDDACNTPFAHSFHVRMHLASHQGLDEFIPYMTRKQMMWLYRNIAYIEHNAGKTAIFDELIQNILTDRGIPLRGFDATQQTDALYAGSNVPSVTFEPLPLNTGQPSDQPQLTTQEMQMMLAAAADGNRQFDDQNPDALTDIGYAGSNRYATKVLESTAMEVSDGISITKAEQAISLWVMAACTGRFNVYTRIIHPVTNAEITVSVLDAYYLFLYAFSKAHSSGLVLMPLLYVTKAPVWPVPSLENITPLVIEGSIPDAFPSQMRSIAVKERTFVNLNQYRFTLDECFRAIEKHLCYRAWPSTFDGKASTMLLFEAFWSEFTYKRPETGKPVQAYFADKDIDLGSMEQNKWIELYTSIFTTITGIDMESASSQGKIQAAMVSIMRRLSSYLVMYVDPSSAHSVQTIGYDNLLIEDTPQTAGTYYDVNIFNLDGYRIEEPVVHFFDIDVATLIMDWYIGAGPTVQELMFDMDLFVVGIDSIDANLIPFRPVDVTPVNLDEEEDVNYVPGLQEMIDSGISFDEIPNNINWPCKPKLPVPGPADPTDWIVTNELPILKIMGTPDPYLGDLQAFSVPSRLRYFGGEEEVIVLNGIWPTHGESTLPIFKFGGGMTKVPLFRYVPFWDGMTLNKWHANIGTLLLNEFSYADVQVGAFVLDRFRANSFFVSMQFEHNPEMRTIEIDAFKANPAGTVTWEWTQKRTEMIQMNRFSKLHETYTMTGLVNGQSTQIFALEQRIEAFDIGHFYNYADPIFLEGFRSQTGMYQLLDMEADFMVFELPDMMSYGIQSLVGITPPMGTMLFSAPLQDETQEPTIDDEPVTPSSIQLQGLNETLNVQFDGMFDVIDLGDLADKI